MPIILVLFIVFSFCDVFGQFKPNGNNLYHVDGNVGIGTQTPSRFLHITSRIGYNDTVAIRLDNPGAKAHSVWDIENKTNLYFKYNFSGTQMLSKMVLTPEGQLSLGTETPNASAIMQINSTTKGLLIPRMTTAQKELLGPVNALLVFDTDLQAFSYYDTNTNTWLNIAETSAFSDYLLISDFNNSVAGGINETDISNWNTAFSWGDHSIAGYITDGNANWDNEYGFITASSADELTNKTGNISMWTNDVGYITEATGTFLWGRQDGNTVLLNLSDNVGIGINNPKKSLHIYNQISDMGFNKSAIRLHNYYETYGKGIDPPPHIVISNAVWDIENNKNKLDFKFGHDAINYPVLTKICFDRDGKIGIDTGEPQTQLHIKNEESSVIRLETNYDNGAIPNPNDPPPADKGNENKSLVPVYWDIRTEETTLHFDLTRNSSYFPSKFKFSSEGTFTATKFVGDGSGLNNVAGAWETNGDHIYYNGGNVGIGTTDPAAKLDINGAIKAQDFYMGHVSSVGSYDFVRLMNNTGDEKFAGLMLNKKDDSGYGKVNDFVIYTYGSRNMNLRTSSGNIILNSIHGNVGIGTDDPDEKLTVNGNVKCRRVIVRADAGADFVFENDYKLMSLQELEIFVKDKKHLPEIQSEREMQENGLELGEMNIKLLQKVEELTLYIIELNKRIESLEDENKELKNE